MRHVVYIVTIPLTAKVHLRGHLRFLRENGYKVTLISSPGEELEEVRIREGIDVVAVPMAREIDVRQDIVSFGALRRVVADLRPDIVNAGTPKAGLLGMLVAKLCGVPIRIYTLHGNRAETLRGLKRQVVLLAERFASASAQHVVCVSKSLSDAYKQMGIVSARKLMVLANGSANGVDAGRFELDDTRCTERNRLRQSLGISADCSVIGFVGRFTNDKGIVDLIQAWRQIRQRIPNLKLLLLGRFEEGDPIPANIAAGMRGNPDVVLPGFIEDTTAYYHLMNVLALPSYREGFPVVPLEAAAAKVPTVGYAATGVIDAVVDGQTGLLSPVGDVGGLADNLSRVLLDPTLRNTLAHNAYDRLLREYQPRQIWTAWLGFYNQLLRQSK